MVAKAGMEVKQFFWITFFLNLFLSQSLKCPRIKKSPQKEKVEKEVKK